MASPEVVAQLSALESNYNAPQRAEAYTNAIQQILASSSPDQVPENLTAYAQSILSENIGVINSRPLLTDFINRIRKLESTATQIEIGNALIDLLQPRIVSYEQQDTDIKFILADAYEKDEDFISSAKTLQTITLDSTQRPITDDEKAKVWMRICRCYLEEDDPTNALAHLNKIKNVIFSVTDAATRLQFQLSQARISDSQRNFLEASNSYLALSTETVIDEEERLQALSAAITAGVLAPAGPQRARQLGKLYKDERSATTPEFGILENIFLDRLLSPAEVATFAAGLKEHQLAKTADGSTVLDKAVLEHNLLAASRVYQNISTTALGALLGVPEERAESQCAAMIESSRLLGCIDQIEGIIYFFPAASSSTSNSAASGGAGAAGTSGDMTKNRQMQDASTLRMRQWDLGVQGLAEEVEKVSTMLQVLEPGWYESQVRGMEARA